MYHHKNINKRKSNVNAYTEDGILVRKLFIPEVPNEMHALSLRKKFTEIGKIEDALIKETYGLVTFVKSKDAAKALRMKLLNAEAADSWRQPSTWKHYNLRKRRKLEKDIINENESLLHLNDDCLLHIFSFLNIFELMSLETTCSRLSDLISSNYNKQYRVVNLTNIFSDNEKTLMEKRLIFIKIGKYIKELTLSGFQLKQPKRLIEMIPKYCKNLEVLRLNQIDTFDERLLQKYLPIFKQLKILSLGNSAMVDLMYEQCIEASDLLLELDLSSNIQTGRWLTKVKNLKYLDISYCEYILPEYFTAMCVNNKSLEYLNIGYCNSLNGKNCQDIVDNLVNLEHLIICTEYKPRNISDMCKFAKLIKLKKFHIKNEYFQNALYDPLYCCFDDVITALSFKDQLESIEIFINRSLTTAINALIRFTKLKELKIKGNYFMNDEYLCKIASKGILRRLYINYCYNITNAGVLKCIELCPDLEIFDLSACNQITEEIIFRLPDLLRKRYPPKKISIGFVDRFYKRIINCHQHFLVENKNLFKITTNDPGLDEW